MKTSFFPLFLTVCSCAFCTLRPNEDIEFALTDTAGQIALNSLQTGYDGAINLELSPYRGIAQTFTVSSTITLSSVQLKIGGFAGMQSAGQFEVAVYGYNPTYNLFSSKIASAAANAAYYDNFLLTDVPVSSFDLSSFGAKLHAWRTYAIALSPLDSFSGRLTVQTQPDNYPGGHSLTFDAPIVIPEPATLTLLAVGALLLRQKHPAAPAV